MNIYLDIDGVLLASEGKSAYYADEFLEFVVKHWPDTTFWLTTHKWRGQDTAVQVLKPALRKKTLPLLEKIKTAEWGEFKTEGISFKQPFLWFDDALYDEEQEILRHYGALDCHRLVNLGKDPMQLLDEIVYLRSLA